MMRKIPDGCVDIVITSPPYNLRTGVAHWMTDVNPSKGSWKDQPLQYGYDNYTDDMPYNDYVKWQRDCLSEMMRLIPDTGAIFYNHKWRIQDKLLQNHAGILEGFPVRQVIIWSKSSGVNHSKSHFTPRYEVIYLIAKRKFLLKGWSGVIGDVWQITSEKKKKNHPATFPEKLVDRILSCVNGKTVLDPFSGSGTTAYVAKKKGFDYIGIELSQKYVDESLERLKE